MRALLLSACSLAAITCGKREEESKKLEDVVARLERIEKKLETSRPPMPQRPPEPDSKTVYSVPVDGDPVVGSSAAKITIVEALDFA
jgi:hypothetical protein